MVFEMTMEHALDSSGMKDIKEVGGRWRFTYKEHQIEMRPTEGGCDWNTYTFKIDNNVIATRATYRTMMRKIKTLLK